MGSYLHLFNHAVPSALVYSYYRGYAFSTTASGRVNVIPNTLTGIDAHDFNSEVIFGVSSFSVSPTAVTVWYVPITSTVSSDYR